jgi:hypothetical protein
MTPHPPYLCPTALEARHWGATYALYRVRIIPFAEIYLSNEFLPVLQWHST